MNVDDWFGHNPVRDLDLTEEECLERGGHFWETDFLGGGFVILTGVRELEDGRLHLEGSPGPTFTKCAGCGKTQEPPLDGLE